MKNKKVKQILFKTCQRCGKKVSHSLRFNNGNARYYPESNCIKPEEEWLDSQEHDFEDKRVYLFEFDGIDTLADRAKRFREIINIEN